MGHVSGTSRFTRAHRDGSSPESADTRLAIVMILSDFDARGSRPALVLGLQLAQTLLRGRGRRALGVFLHHFSVLLDRATGVALRFERLPGADERLRRLLA